jgi:hypothetical protein
MQDTKKIKTYAYIFPNKAHMFNLHKRKYGKVFVVFVLKGGGAWKRESQCGFSFLSYNSGFQTFLLAAPIKRPENFRGTPNYVKKIKWMLKSFRTSVFNKFL